MIQCRSGDQRLRSGAGQSGSGAKQCRSGAKNIGSGDQNFVISNKTQDRVTTFTFFSANFKKICVLVPKQHSERDKCMGPSLRATYSGNGNTIPALVQDDKRREYRLKGNSNGGQKSHSP